jgi:hypothetical protein
MVHLCFSSMSGPALGPPVSVKLRLMSWRRPTSINGGKRRPHAIAEDERGGRTGAAARSRGSNRMSREATFRQNDITRALRAAGAAGCEVRRIEISRDGKIVLVLTEPADAEREAASSEIVL